ncbi:SDR family NAD(P)-dependent oxidoreductase [Actinoplanes derwentensis]|uniref:NAD(P)-dependent dehydrogenase, short-chain alcohol dehydrogenase family n=1 Tax=Actinoplanes derwentensis TaxID=113562 RepID=A0A1H1UPG3_9ACTN|nr:SDR family NAD(P)-dependent oxidoreductase [Actinoplanes derwentensis]GID88127.1 putative short-chain type dehydrogenase/reductase [Actinoplanes derwentensis]SDS74385.1 NAD(P)-dependent dehydrogenase, short-chain alcohol dehydrogenase family [Actinoplanes derwentensis]
MTDLTGKVALISGTGRGVGRAAALEFVARGAMVFGADLDAAANAETERLAESQLRLAVAEKGQMRSLAPVDLGNQVGADAWTAAAVEAFGGIDILYNNASALRHGPIDTIPEADWYFTIQNELHLVFHCVRAAWPHLVARGGGVIINVASVAAKRGVAFTPMAPHGAAKGAVLALTRHLAAQGADVGIRANTISPGMIRTPETAQFVDDPDGPVPGLLAQTPSRRVGEPADVAKLAAFLAGDDATFINGADIAIDGGVSAMGG